MLWTVRHRWPAGARFAFNCYRHAAQLILRKPGRPCSILLSQEGVTQGDPLSMVLYGLALLPLAKSLRDAKPAVLQPWYADDMAMHGHVNDITDIMRLLLKEGPQRGYFPEPAKSICICDLQTQNRVRPFLEEFKFQYKEGYRYLGGYIGTTETLQQWLQPKVAEWAEGVQELAHVARKFPQTA